MKLLAVSCCCCFSPGQGVRCVGNAKTSDGVFALRVCLQGGVAAVVFSSTFFGRAHPCRDQGGSGIELSCGDKKCDCSCFPFLCSCVNAEVFMPLNDFYFPSWGDQR